MFRPSVLTARSLSLLAILSLAFSAPVAAVGLGETHEIARGYLLDIAPRGDFYWLTWFHPDGTAPGRLLMRELDADGRPVGPVRRYFGGRGIALLGDAALVAGVSQLSSDGRTGKIWVATLDANGLRGPRRVVGEWTGGDVVLGAWGDDGFALAYRDPSTSLFVLRLDREGVPTGPPRLVVALPPLADDSFPIRKDWLSAVALASRGGELLVAWETEGRWDPRHYYSRGPFVRFLGIDGETGPVLRLWPGTRDEMPLGVVAMELDGGLACAWMNPVGRVLLQGLDPAAGVTGPPVPVTRRRDNWSMDLAADPRGGGFAAWSRNARDGFHVLGRWLGAGARPGPAFPIGEGGDPAVAVGADGGALAVWQVYTQDGAWLLQARRVWR